MCAGRTWVNGLRLEQGEITITRLAGTIYLVVPPNVLDEAVGAVLAATMADLAGHQPDVVLDLTHVDTLGERGGRSILRRLNAVAQQAGGRLLVACRSGDSAGFALRDLDDEGGIAAAPAGPQRGGDDERRR